LRLKAVSLREACKQLSSAAGVKIQASRGIADENITIMVRDQPARNVMGAISGLFGFRWARMGEAGATQYELVQDLQSQRAEADLRARDLQSALTALDEQMHSFGPLLDVDRDELRERERAASGDEKRHLDSLLRNWSAYQVYARLTPAQRQKLVNGQPVELESGAADPARRLPGELRTPLLDDAGVIVESRGVSMLARVDPREGTPLSQVSDAVATVHLSVTHSELGEARLMCGVGGYVRSRPELGRLGGPALLPAAVAQSPGSAQPENARVNARLRTQPGFQKTISIRPESSCVVFKPGATPPRQRIPSYVDTNGLPQFGAEPPHVFSSDVWEAVHDQTGMPVVADAYTRVFPLEKVEFKSGTVFDGVCQVSDHMGVKWRQEGDFLLARSARYYWDKHKEVPKRLLDQWRSDRKKNAGLPLSSLLEIARLRDEQLNSAVIGKVAEHCYGLDEWGIVANTGFRVGIHYSEMVPFARMLASLTPAQRLAANSRAGLPYEDVPAPWRAVIGRRLSQGELGPDFLAGMRIRFQYVPSGRLIWVPSPTDPALGKASLTWPLISGLSSEEVLAAARGLDPGADPSQIRKSAGVLEFTCLAGDGRIWKLGEPR
jgi:hypothetical protein